LRTPAAEVVVGVRDGALAMLIGVLAAGCGGSSGGAGGNGAVASFEPVGDESPVEPGDGSYAEPGTPAPRVHERTPEGVSLFYPAWLDAYPQLKARVLDELRTTSPDADPRIASGVQGVPAGTTIIVLEPGAYWAPYSPTHLATGEWRAPSTIYVAWTGDDDEGPLLPALSHELRHLLTGDPHAGH
jgi:hypothetical protein